MRKYIKERIIELFKSVHECHQTISGMIDSRDFDNAVYLLSECQNAAIEIGNTIEKSEGEGLDVIHWLEEYCENVYRLSEKIEQKSGQDVKNELENALSQSERFVKEEIKVKFEVVFMPYKISMWDSLESIWEAANNDPDCDAYVVPIPYYDRNPDHSFAEMHYEGNLFPDEIKVTHFSLYNFEERCPDIIYIHNPYDDNNYVTSVDPRFYSNNLKKYTECLVYIPYCVYDEPFDTNTIQTKRFFERYDQPVIRNADVVVLQSEIFRAPFVRMMISNYGNEEYWNKKIIAIGSPKYDSVYKYSNDAEAIPDDWKKQIYKSDGSRKKVCFYNIGLGSILKFGEAELSKIEYVIDYFKRNKDEMTLLWRPHPLFESTLISMRPALHDQYIKLVHKYIEEEIGIFDSFPQASRAIAISDVYYGDYSSLCLLYRVTNKPILLQHPYVVSDKKTLIPSATFYDGKYVWCTALHYNGLYRIEINTGKAEFVCRFEEEPTEQYYGYSEIVQKDNKLILCPFNASSIVIYEKNNNKYISIPLKKELKDINSKFINCLTQDRYVYFMGHYAYSIIRMDVETYNIEYIENWVQEIKNRGHGGNDYWGTSMCVHGSQLYCACSDAECIMCIDLSNQYYQIGKIKSFGSGGNILINTQNGIWVLPNGEGFIAFYDVERSYVKRVTERIIADIYVYTDERIYCFSKNDSHFYIYNTETRNLVKGELNNIAISACAIQNNIMVFCINGDCYIIDTKSNQLQAADIKFDNSLFYKTKIIDEINSWAQINGWGTESGYMNLNRLMESDIKAERSQEKANVSIGSEIYLFTKNKVYNKKDGKNG